jgi:hypothetical protein
MAVVETSADHAASRTEEPTVASYASEHEMQDMEDLISKLNCMPRSSLVCCGRAR